MCTHLARTAWVGPIHWRSDAGRGGRASSLWILSSAGTTYARLTDADPPEQAPKQARNAAMWHYRRFSVPVHGRDEQPNATDGRTLKKSPAEDAAGGARLTPWLRYQRGVRDWKIIQKMNLARSLAIAPNCHFLYNSRRNRTKNAEKRGKAALVPIVPGRAAARPEPRTKSATGTEPHPTEKRRKREGRTPPDNRNEGRREPAEANATRRAERHRTRERGDPRGTETPPDRREAGGETGRTPRTNAAPRRREDARENGRRNRTNADSQTPRPDTGRTPRQPKPDEQPHETTATANRPKKRLIGGIVCRWGDHKKSAPEWIVNRPFFGAAHLQLSDVVNLMVAL